MPAGEKKIVVVPSAGEFFEKERLDNERERGTAWDEEGIYAYSLRGDVRGRRLKGCMGGGALGHRLQVPNY